MSYDLVFWREIEPHSATPTEVYKKLCEDVDLVGLDTLNRDDVVEQFKKEFPDISVGEADLVWEGNDSYFQVSMSNPIKVLFVMCGHRLLDSPDIINKIIDVGHRLKCPLYDPQTDQRYILSE